MYIKHNKGIIRATGVLILNNAAVIGGIMAPPTIDITGATNANTKNNCFI